MLARLAPNPTEGNPPRCLIGEGDKAVPTPWCLTRPGMWWRTWFQVIFDPFVGKLALFRIPPGNGHPRQPAVHRRWPQTFQVGHLFTLFGKEHRR